MNKQDTKPSRQHGVREVIAYHIPATGEPPVREETRIIREDALSLDIEDVGTYTLMWTPTESLEDAMGFDAEDGVLADSNDPEALAMGVGFTFTEGIISGLDDIKTMAMCEDQEGVLRMQLKHPEEIEVRRKNVVMTSSCGICGGREFLENNVLGLEPVPTTLRLEAAEFQKLMAKMKDRQAVFAATGAAHAAAVFDPDGEILAVAEDLGRHNALDKVIGKCLLQRKQTRGCGVVLSSRLSLEMITKAVRAGFEIVAAVSAPTSMAVDVAERFGVTLCAFVRGDRVTIYSHPERIFDTSSS